MENIAEGKSIFFENLSIGYDSDCTINKFPVVSSKVHKAEFIVLLGRNGIGKSTLLRTLSGLMPPISGNLFLMDKNIDKYSQKEKASTISFVSTEKPDIANLTVIDVVSLGRYSYTNWIGTLNGNDNDIIYQSMEMTGIAHLAHKNINEISDGEKQRAMISRSLAQNTPIIILDEPTAFLDLPTKFEIMLLLRNLAWNENKTIILSTHDLNIAMQLADIIWIMTNDELKQDSPEDIALKHGLNDLFNDTGIKFDYKKGIVDTGTNYTKEISLNILNSDINFWTTKALNRIGYNVVEKSNIKIEFENNNFVIKENTNSTYCSSVRELIKKVKTI